MKAKQDRFSKEPDSIIDSPYFTEIQIPFPLNQAVTLDFPAQALGYNQIHIHKSKNLLGSGTSGEVSSATFKFQLVAAKNYYEDRERLFYEEVYTLTDLQHHPYILKLFAYSAEELCLVTELMPGGSLGNLLKKENLDWETIIKIAAQVASVLDYLHSVKNYVYGDLKSHNVLVDRYYNIKLADFETTGIEQTHVLTGTLGWTASEILEFIAKACSSPDLRVRGIVGSVNTKMAEIFSFGIFLLELLLGERFDKEYLLIADQVYIDKSFVEYIPTLLGEIIADLKRENHFPLPFIELVEACLQKDPHKRPTSQQILSTFAEFPELAGQIELKNKERKVKARTIDPLKEKYEAIKKVRLQYAIAAEMGDLKKLKELSNAGFDSNLGDSHGVTALMIAAHRGHADVVSFLISISEDCSSLKTTSGWTALRSAVLNGNHRIAELLLDARSDPNSLFIDNTSLLMLAARNGYTELIELLINRGADINYRNSEGWTALNVAIIHNQTASVLKLCELGACLNPSEGSIPLFTAASKGNIEIVRLLVERGAEIAPPDEPYGETALHYAVRFGQLDIANFLIEKDIRLIDKPFAASIQALMNFAETKGVHKELSAFLSHEGKLPLTLPGFTALHLAAFFDYPQIIGCLFKAGAKIIDTDSGINVMQLAEIMKNHEAVLELNRAPKEQRYKIKFFDFANQSLVDEKPQANASSSWWCTII